MHPSWDIISFRIITDIITNCTFYFIKIDSMVQKLFARTLIWSNSIFHPYMYTYCQHYKKDKIPHSNTSTVYLILFFPLRYYSLSHWDCLRLLVSTARFLYLSLSFRRCGSFSTLNALPQDQPALYRRLFIEGKLGCAVYILVNPLGCLLKELFNEY